MSIPGRRAEGALYNLISEWLELGWAFCPVALCKGKPRKGKGRSSGLGPLYLSQCDELPIIGSAIGWVTLRFGGAQINGCGVPSNPRFSARLAVYSLLIMTCCSFGIVSKLCKLFHFILKHL